jgi:hypothetical protein
MEDSAANLGYFLKSYCTGFLKHIQQAKLELLQMGSQAELGNQR